MSKENMVISFQQLSIVSNLHYENHKKARKKAVKFFEKLDEDGDGWITKEEVMGSKLVTDLGKNFMKKALKGVDGDADGYITFDESKSLLYLSEYSKRKCRACGRSLRYGHGFSCIQCVQEQADDFNLCYRCFESRGIEHARHGYLHFLHDFAFLNKLLEMSLPALPHRLLSPVETMEQCSICGDFHESNVKGFMCDTHMCPMPDSYDYVCEWCFCYFCFKCGNPFRDNPKTAVPGKWLQRFQCLTCSQQQRSRDIYGLIIQRYQDLLSNAAIIEQCKTCKTKQRNGRLFVYINGSNTLKANDPRVLHGQHKPQHQQLQPLLPEFQTEIIQSPIKVYEQPQLQYQHASIYQPPQVQFQPETESRKFQVQMEKQPQPYTERSGSKKTMDAMKTAAGVLAGVALGGVGLGGMGTIASARKAIASLSGAFSGGQGGVGRGGQGFEPGPGQGFGPGRGRGFGPGRGRGFGPGRGPWFGPGPGQGFGPGPSQGFGPGQGHLLFDTGANNNFADTGNPNDAFSPILDINLDFPVDGVASSFDLGSYDQSSYDQSSYDQSSFDLSNVYF